MGKRTPQSGFSPRDEAQELETMVTDKRPSKRAGRAKGRRRDRRYENRLRRIPLDGMDLEATEPMADGEDNVMASVSR